MQKQLELFGSLFDTSPNLAILHINNDCNEINRSLQNIVDNSFGELTTKEFQQIQTKTFRLKDRNFEYAIVSNCLDEVENQDKFIDEIYHSLENSAFIIVLENKENMDTQKIIDLLDTNNFRAVNNIDIFENYHLVMGKKLHMWGNGL